MEKHLGLTQKEVDASREMHGENRLSRPPKRSFLREFFTSFTDPMIVILLVALCLNLLFSLNDGEYFEAMGIAGAVLLSVLVSTLSEYKSERAFERLREQAEQLSCRVRRDGRVTTLGAEQLVVGDVVLLGSGDCVPADCRIFKGELYVDQSALNGESREVRKHPSGKAESLRDSAGVFSATTILSGDAEARVVRVGDATLYGKLALSLGELSRKSPLKEKLGRLAKTIAKIGYAAAFFIAAFDFLGEIWSLGSGDIAAGLALAASSPALILEPLLHALTLAVTVVVVSVPEGLPMMITVVLSAQMRKMLKEGVLLRKLAGIETAGTMDLLFCDKTGTLTEGTHSLSKTLLFDGVGLSEYTPDEDTKYRHFALNNEAHRVGKNILGSNATDRALLKETVSSREAPHVTHRLPFSAERKYSTVTLSDASYLCKGAPEKLIRLCTHVRTKNGILPLDAALQGSLLSAVEREEEKGARMVAFAEGTESAADKVPKLLTLCFFAALTDRLRPETRKTVHTLQQAGVQVVMLTGDSEATACTIARRAGILTKEGTVLSSDALARLDDDAVRALLPTLSVVYRCTPSDKSRLAALASEEGRVTGMTGDGVNDAPALKRADVGFAMGSGTQLARDSADVVLTDDRLSSLSRAVLYGRCVTSSIQKFIVFQLTMNFCALSVSLLGPLFGIETPITILQMLWVNLIMDTFASLAFSGEAPRKSLMEEKPKARTAPILARKELGTVLFGTLFCVLVCSCFLNSTTLRTLYSYTNDPLPFLTAFFSLFVFLGVANLFNVRTKRQKLWSNLSKNPAFVIIALFICAVQITLCLFGSSLFSCAKLPWELLTLPILLSALIIPADLLRKNILYQREKNTKKVTVR